MADIETFCNIAGDKAWCYDGNCMVDSDYIGMAQKCVLKWKIET